MENFYDIINKYPNHRALGGNSGDTGIEQNKYELNALCNFVIDNNIKSWLEIGIAKGQLMRFMKNEMNLNTIGVTLPEFAENHNELNVIYGSSRDAVIVDKISKYVIKNNKFDMIFVDGDHSYEGVKFDYNNYKDKCKFMGFHDACGLRDCHGVPRFLNEIKEQYKDTYTIFEDKTEFRSGIAIIKL